MQARCKGDMANSLIAFIMNGMFSIGMGKLSTMVFSLIGMMIVARYLPAQDFGSFILATVMASFLSEMSGLGLSVSLAKFIADRQEETYRRELFNTAIYFQLFVILVVSIVALTLRKQIATLFGAGLPLNLAIFVPILFSLQSLTFLLQAMLQGLCLFPKIGLSELIASLLNFFLTCLFVLVLQAGVVGLIYARVIAALAILGILYQSIPVKKRLEFHPSLLKEVLIFGFPLHINDILSFIFNRIDTIIVGVLLGSAGVAHYEIARKIPEHLRQIYEAFRSVYFPLMSRLLANGEKEKSVQVLNNAIRLISFITIAGALIALLFGKEIIIFLFSEQYAPSIPAFIILMVALNVGLIGYTLGISVVAAGDSDKPAIVNIIHTLVSLVSNLLLIPTRGITGAALASLTGIIATNPLDVMFLRRRSIDIHVMEYLKPIALFGAHAALFLLLPHPTLFHKLLIGLSFLITSFYLSIITPADLHTLYTELKPVLLKPLKKLNAESDKS